MSVLLVTETKADTDRFRTALQSGGDGPCDVRVLGSIEALLQEKGTREQGDASPSQACSTVAVVDWDMLRSYGEGRGQSPLALEDDIPYPVLVLIRAEGEAEHCCPAERQALRWGAQDCWYWHELLETGGAAIARDLEKAIERYQRIKHLHQARAQAHHEASFLRSVVEANPTLMAVKDGAGKYVVVNSALALLYGTTPAQMIGCREIEINPNEAQARLHEREEQKVLQDGQQRETVQEPYKDSAGTIRWIQSVRQPLLNSQGDAQWVLVVMNDVTARQAAEHALWVQAERSRLLGQMTQAVHGPFELSEILKTAAQQVRQFLEVDRVMVYSLQPPSGEGELRAIDVARGAEIEPEVEPQLLAMYQSWSGEQGQQLGIDDPAVVGFPSWRSLHQGVHRWAAGETRQTASAETESLALAQLERLKVRSLLVVPILAGAYFLQEAQGSGNRAIALEGETAIEPPLGAARTVPGTIPGTIPVPGTVTGDEEPDEFQCSGVWGWLVAHQCRAERPWSQWEYVFLRNLAEQLSIAIQQATLYNRLGQVNRRLAELATVDGLTGIPNRRLFDQTLQQEWQRGRRLREPLALMVADIDFFKAYNDHYGHLAGDDCLQQVAQTLAAVAKRSTDLAFRYGGEEFAIILPNTHLQGAIAVAQQILDVLWDAALDHAYSKVARQVTLSLGLTSMVPGRRQRPGSLIQRADQALFMAKEAGRNRAIALDAQLSENTPVQVLHPQTKQNRIPTRLPHSS